MEKKTMVVISLCAGLNISLGSIVYLLKLPIYLDMVGTILCAFLMWPMKKKAFLCSASSGVLSFFIGGILINPFLPWFSLTVISVAAFSSFITARFSNVFRNVNPSNLNFVLPVIGYGICTGLLAAVISAPVVTYLFGGATGSGTAMLVAFFIKTGNQLLKASFLSGFAAEPIDKTIQLFLAIMLYRATPKSFLDNIQN